MEYLEFGQVFREIQRVFGHMDASSASDYK